MKDALLWHAHWRVEKFRSEESSTPYAVREFEGNLALNQGINHLWTLGCGGAGTAWDNSNAYLGVGDSQVATNASHTGLQAASNKTWKGMEATYPQYGSNQQAIFKSSFASGEANYAWEEFTLSNSNDDSGENLNRKVQSLGTKTSGEVWTLTLTLTLG